MLSQFVTIYGPALKPPISPKLSGSLKDIQLLVVYEKKKYMKISCFNEYIFGIGFNFSALISSSCDCVYVRVCTRTGIIRC